MKTHIVIEIEDTMPEFESIVMPKDDLERAADRI